MNNYRLFRWVGCLGFSKDYFLWKFKTVGDFVGYIARATEDINGANSYVYNDWESVSDMAEIFVWEDNGSVFWEYSEGYDTVRDVIVYPKTIRVFGDNYQTYDDVFVRE